MADYMKDIYPLIAKPLQVAQQNLDWLKGFQAQQQAQTQQSQYGYTNQTAYPYTSFSNGFGTTPTTSYNTSPYNNQYPVQAYNPASSFQIQQMMQQYYGSTGSSTGSTTTSVNNNSQNSLNNILLPLLLLKLLNKKSSSSSSSSDDDGDTVDPATAKVTELLAKTAADDGTTDTDNDGFVVSDADYTALKAAVNDGSFSQADLESSLSTMLLTSDLGQVDELSTLLAKSQDDGLVDVDNVLSPSVLSALSSERQTLLAQSLAQNGLIKANGSANTDVTNFLVNSLSKAGDTAENQFAKLTVKKLVNQWITNPPAVLPDADQDQLVSLLKLEGFKFKPDGSLEDDALQPFSVQS